MTSPALNSELRTIESALFQSARERGRLALATWQRTVYLNIIENAAGFWINDHPSLTEAALLAADEKAYVVTIAINPSGCFPMHLTQLGEHIGTVLPHAEAGDA